MINANITNHIQTHIGDFTVNVAFAKDVEDFDLANVSFAAVSGNGTMGVSFLFTGSGSNYMITVIVPDGVEGSFSVNITGQVTVDGSAQDVVATERVFSYDTIFDVRTTFGGLRYNDEKIVLPINFAEDVLWFDKSDLLVEGKAGSDAYLIDYYIRGKDADYEVVFNPALGTWGAVCVDITGEVVKEADLVREIVNVDPLLISYNHLSPVLADVGTPFKSDDGWWNIAVAFEYPVVGFGIHSIITGISHTQLFIYQGMSLDVKPEIDPPAFSDVYPFESVQGQHCVGDWISVGEVSTEQGRYFWVKLNTVSDEMPEIFLKEEDAILKSVSVG